MKTIDESRLESDPTYRFQYLAEFIGFDAHDANAVLATAPYLGPMIPQLVERTYEKLLAYTATARHFVPRQAGYEGPTPESLANITVDHPQIQFRKEHLSRYFMQILSRPCDAKLVPYLDMVGKIHTPRAGNADIDVPLVQMNALMGYLSSLLLDVLATLPLDPTTMAKTTQAFNKLLWIQNDFISRHYQSPGQVAAAG